MKLLTGVLLLSLEVQGYWDYYGWYKRHYDWDYKASWLSTKPYDYDVKSKPATQVSYFACPSGWQSHKIDSARSCFKYIGYLPAKEANQTCVDFGGQLPVPTSESSNKDLRKMANTMVDSKYESIVLGVQVLYYSMATNVNTGLYQWWENWKPKE